MLHDPDLVSVQEARAKVEEAYEAWQRYRAYTQEQVDAIVEAVAAAGAAQARELAELAVEETGMGRAADKEAKNLLTSRLLLQRIRGLKTVGVVRERVEERITEIGVGLGVVAAICPTTNPTSTVNYKVLIALKSGNAIVVSPHPRASRSTCAAAGVLRAAAEKAGAPAGLIQCLERSTLDSTQALMKHPKTGVVLATGGAGMVRAAYSSGKPAYGVGPGNVPVWLDGSADVEEAVGRVVAGKSFDYGTVCSSEQTLVAERGQRAAVLAALRRRGAYLLSDEERRALERTLFSGTTTVRAECVGQSPQKIAQLAGFAVPAETTILAAEIEGVGKNHPLSAEKLSPVLALLFVDSFEAGLAACEAILQFGGLGHTSVIHAKDEGRVRAFGLRMPSFRVLVNTSSPQGSVGITTNLQPSMTLGCGAIAGNITSDNVGPQHLMNVKRVAWSVREPEEAMGAPAKTGSLSEAERGALVAAVERYVSEHGLKIEKKAPSCGCGPKAEAPRVEIAAFVCEEDVRRAAARGEKIYIDTKTIVTPAAREADRGGTVLRGVER